MKKAHLIGAEALVSVIIVFLMTVRLESVPPLWWDEGWTLSVARNWIETGRYQRLLAGKLVSHGLEAAPTVTGSIYIAFRLFGVGIFQARMVGVLYTLATLLVIYYLARRLYDRKIALTTVLILTFTPAYTGLIPMYLGRQVLGEMPAMFFLLLGYGSFMVLLHRHVLWLLLPILLWGIALSTKLQVLPFWLSSMGVTSAALLYHRHWQLFLRFAVVCVASLVSAQLLVMLWQYALWRDGAAGDAVTGLYEVTAAVTSIPARMFALIVLVLFGLPTLVGLCHAAWSMLARRGSFENPVEYIRLSLLILAGSWFFWFVVLSVGWIRYVFPATFIGSIFVAAMMHDLTRGFDVSYTMQSLAVFKGRRINKQVIGALFIAAFILTSVPRTAVAVYETYLRDADNSVQEAAEFLNSQTRPDALIETYDSELFFLLNRPYHYPPDQIHVELIRRTFLYDDTTVINYDPLSANPDYLVVGPHSKQWRLYDDIVKSGAFRLLRSYRRYLIYERAR